MRPSGIDPDVNPDTSIAPAPPDLNADPDVDRLASAADPTADDSGDTAGPMCTDDGLPTYCPPPGPPGLATPSLWLPFSAMPARPAPAEDARMRPSGIDTDIDPGTGIAPAPPDLNADPNVDRLASATDLTADDSGDTAGPMCTDDGLLEK